MLNLLNLLNTSIKLNIGEEEEEEDSGASQRLGIPGCFLLPVGIGKCILVVGDTVGAMMHAPTACVQGCSRSRGEVVSG